jgi:hypothetical protein
VALPSLLDSQNDNWQHKAQMTKLKIVFAEGAFDGFDGTQEELDAIIADLKEQLADGTLFDNAIPVAEDDPELLQAMSNKPTRQ